MTDHELEVRLGRLERPPSRVLEQVMARLKRPGPRFSFRLTQVACLLLLCGLATTQRTPVVRDAHPPHHAHVTGVPAWGSDDKDLATIDQDMTALQNEIERN
jgi:hypothetical protein